MRKEIFYFGDKYKNITMGLSIAASWTWAPALILSTDIAANSGISGMLSFIIPNILALIFFGYMQTKINPDALTSKWLFNDKIYGNFYELLMLLIQICCICIQIMAGANVLKFITNIDYKTIAIVLLLIVYLYSYKGGFHYSVITDVYQHIILILGSTLLLLVFVFNHNVEFSKINYIFNLKDCVLYSLILLSGPFMDNQHWQRSFNGHREFKPFLWSAVFFSIPLIALSLIGLLSNVRGSYVSLGLFNGFWKYLLVICILSGLFSTLDSAMASLLTLFYTEKETINHGRIKMIVGLIISYFIVSFNIEILTFWKTYGSIRIIFAFIILVKICLQNQKRKNIAY